MTLTYLQLITNESTLTNKQIYDVNFFNVNFIMKTLLNCFLFTCQFGMLLSGSRRIPLRRTKNSNPISSSWLSFYLSAFNAFRREAAKQICKFRQTSAMPLNVSGSAAVATVDEHSMAMAWHIVPTHTG